MKPAQFSYVRAVDTRHALEALARTGADARVLAGGQSLMAILNMRLAEPRWLIDISRTAELDVIEVDRKAGLLIVKSAVTQGSVEWRPTLGEEVPLLKAVFPYISHFQIRNRGTVCGSVAHADPSAELPLALVTLGGDVVLRSAKRTRAVPAADFLQGMLMTAREPDELVEAVRFPLKRSGERFAFTEFSARHGDFALVACAAMVTDDAIRIGVGGVADRPIVESLPKLDGDDLRGALNDFAWKLGARDDAHVSASYRRHLVRQLAWKAIEEAK
ncbi:2-furoyl-CoA dehydrogenase FAD binding subunit [Trinickia symbiotica]|uniref:Carbon monoxide dehydrogenase n=1 Tax=Trinickia symbiotica TaxID=863227 RepID=A0A2N7X1W3_9BURK|nr:FAD binding domain-containing protein [Trinickia symbiotica]PMS35465.1 carbon monoxide dehydrogenase [Trinickia symbiotica]PPK45493.1 2-furoyl-CoA dehydrogenase FAD binding subunit [Trinickia symbiotica]